MLAAGGAISVVAGVKCAGAGPVTVAVGAGIVVIIGTAEGTTTLDTGALDVRPLVNMLRRPPPLLVGCG